MTFRSDVKCPLMRVREALHLDRKTLAALAEVDCARVIAAETGNHASIPSRIINALGPSLAGLGTTPEKLQEEFRAWRRGLGDEIRRRTAKNLKERAAV